MMIKLFAYPDEFSNDQVLEKHYEKLFLHKDDYINNRINLDRFNSNNYLATAFAPVNYSAWTNYDENALKANAFNTLHQNRIGIFSCFHIVPRISIAIPNYSSTI